jgi:hypothetical protein
VGNPLSYYNRKKWIMQRENKGNTDNQEITKKEER